MPYIASMGIYVLKASAIKKLLTDHFPEVCLLTITHTCVYIARCHNMQASCFGRYSQYVGVKDLLLIGVCS